MPPLTNECHGDGFSSRISQLVRGGTKSAHTKAALNPRIAGGYVVNPARQHMLAAIGEDVFRKVHNPSTDFWTQLKSIMLPGYNQMAHATGLRDAHLNNVRELGSQLQRLYKRDATGNIINMRDPRVQGVIAKIQGNAKTFRGQQNQSFAEIGSMAEPRIKFFRNAVPAAAGIAGGGAAFGAAGHLAGERRGQRQQAQQMESMPLMQRLKYLVAPGSVFGKQAMAAGMRTLPKVIKPINRTAQSLAGARPNLQVSPSAASTNAPCVSNPNAPKQ